MHLVSRWVVQNLHQMLWVTSKGWCTHFQGAVGAAGYQGVLQPLLLLYQSGEYC